MVNLLEVLYVLTVASALVAGVQWARGRPGEAGHFAKLGIVFAAAAVALYGYLD